MVRNLRDLCLPENRVQRKLVYSKSFFRNTQSSSKFSKKKYILKSFKSSKKILFEKNSNIKSVSNFLKEKRKLKNIAKTLFPHHFNRMKILSEIIKDIQILDRFLKNDDFFKNSLKKPQKLKIRKKFFEKERFIFFIEP